MLWAMPKIHVDSRRGEVELPGALPDHDHHVVEHLLDDFPSPKKLPQVPVQSGSIAPIERFECLPILCCHPPDQVEVVVFRESRADLLGRDRAFGGLDASAAS